MNAKNWSQKPTLGADKHFSSRGILVSSQLGDPFLSTIGSRKGIPVRRLKFFKSGFLWRKKMSILTLKKDR